MTDTDVSQLRQALIATQSPDLKQRKQAEVFLESMEVKPMYAQTLIGIVESHCAGSTNDDKVMRTLAAVVFKNLVKAKWVPEDDGDGKDSLPESDKTMIKSNLVPLMCRSPPEVQRQFAEALTIISKHDFPAKWSTLVTDLVALFKSEDYHVLNGALLSANSVMKRYRYTFKSDALFGELKNIVLPNMVAPLLTLFKNSFTAAEQYRSSREHLVQVMEVVRLVMRIFYSLNWQDLPEAFEDSMGQWMDGFHTYLTTYSNPLLNQPEGSDEPGPLDRVQAAIVENIRLYTDKYDEEFEPHLPRFAQAVWGLLMKVSAGKHHDVLAITCIKFLTLVVGKAIHKQLFGSEDILCEIVKNIAVPNVTMRDADEETFNVDPEEYISGDIEGGDSETRRRGACDLLRGMCKHYEEPTTRICSTFVGNMWQEYAQNPAGNWRAKDAALQLVLALSIRAQSQAGGVSKTNAHIDVMKIFSEHVLPEIQDSDVNARPIVRADCLKMVFTFRNQFSVPELVGLMPLLIAHLRSEHAVVVTYSAMAIERMMAIKDRAAGRRPTLRLNKDVLSPFLEPLFTNLFAVMDQEDENDHLMKTVMRALNSAQEKVLPITQIVLTKLNGYLQRVCKNPSKPRFNHFLFESIAVLVQHCLREDPQQASMLEGTLFPPFHQILTDDVVEFMPYVFQILAQMLELRPAGEFSDLYKGLFAHLLMPAVWVRKGNVPAVTRLLQAYLTQNGMLVVEWGHLEGVLGVFQKLLSSSANEALAFQLLGTVILNVDRTKLDQYLAQIFQLLLMRLEAKSNKIKFVRHLTVFFSTFIVKHGVHLFEQCLQQQQGAGLLTMLMTQFWIPNFSNRLVLSPAERKVQVVGMTQLMCSCSEVKQNVTLWSGLLTCVMEILVPEDAPQRQEDAQEKDSDEEEDLSFDSAFSKLRMTNTGAEDPAPEITSEVLYLATSLGKLCNAEPGKYPPLIVSAMEGRPSGRQAFESYVREAGVTLA